ncbi:5091_t:CDS:2, partial [Diversispora eburnea]
RLTLIALTALLIITMINVYSSKIADWINQSLAIVKTLTVITIAIIGLIEIKNSTNWNDAFKRTDDSLDEFDDPKRNLIYNNTISVGIVGVLLLYFANAISGRVFGKILSFFVALSAFGTMGSLIWSGSRVIVTAGHRSYFPVFSDKLQKISKRGTPMNALLLQFILGAIVIILVGGAHRNSFQVLYSMAQYTSWLFYGLIGIGLIRIRLININNENKKNQKEFWWIVIFMYIACALYITVVSFVGTSNSNNVCSIPKVSYYLPNGISLGFLVIGFISWITLYSWRNDNLNPNSTPA